MLSLSEAQNLKEDTPGSPCKEVIAHGGWPVMDSSTKSHDTENSFWQASLFLPMTTSHPSARENHSPSSVLELSGFLVIVGPHEAEVTRKSSNREVS